MALERVRVLASIVLLAALPSLRLGLAAMLEQHGHVLVHEGDADESAVWVLDAPDPGLLDHLLGARAEAETPRALVALTDDAAVVSRLQQAELTGWACLGRDVEPGALDAAVRAAWEGMVVLDLAFAHGLQGGPGREPAHLGGPPVLTAREMQVLQLVAQGLPNKGIARALDISENTAKFHVSSLTGKLGGASRTEAVSIAARRGLIVL